MITLCLGSGPLTRPRRALWRGRFLLAILIATFAGCLASPPTASPDVTPTTTPAATGTPSPVEPTAAEVRVLCDGQSFDGYEATPFRLGGGVDADPSVQKVIRNCTFRNSDVVAIRIGNARNVLIEGSTFDNIRTLVPGDGVHAIVIPGADPADGIVIRGNHFERIGADGMQLADSGRLVSNVLIEANTFVGSEDVGENAIDVKGADGPILIRGNTWSGFRPCESPRKGGTQDCSGSDGAGVVIHDGEASGRASNVTVTGNTAVDNTIGLVVSTADDVTVTDNTFRDSLELGLFVGDVTGCQLGVNTFVGQAQGQLLQRADC